MPRKGEFTRDFTDPDIDSSQAQDYDIGRREWMVHTSMSTRRNLSVRIIPSRYACSVLATELAQEWAEYVEAAGLTASSVQSYQQAVASFCSSVDNRLGGTAPNASLAQGRPDLARAVAAWERRLPSNFPAGSTRPSILAQVPATALHDYALGDAAAGDGAVRQRVDLGEVLRRPVTTDNRIHGGCSRERGVPRRVVLLQSRAERPVRVAVRTRIMSLSFVAPGGRLTGVSAGERERVVSVLRR